MNRIQHFDTESDIDCETSAVAQAATSAVSAKFLERSVDSEIALFCPQHYESGYAYPLIVWLHGPGDDESQLKRLMPFISLRNYVAVAPRGPIVTRRKGQLRYNWSERPAEFSQAEDRVFEAIDYARQRMNVAEHRVFIAGFDRGGTVAFRIALAHPERFAGVISLNGRFPAGRAPLAKLERARRVPLLLSCGRDSEEYPTTAVCEHLRLFHSAGMHIALRQYPCGHEISPLMLSDMDRWIMEQITSPSVNNR